MSAVRCSANHKHVVETHPGARKRAVGRARDAATAVCKGGTWAGEGASRSAHLFGEVIYKVPLYCQCDTEEDCDEQHDPYGHQSEVEFQAANGWRGRRHPLVSPTSMYVVDGVPVIAQPMVEVASTRAEEAEDNWCEGCETYHGPKRPLRVERGLARVQNALGVGDLHADNYGYTLRANRLRVFDLGIA